MEAADFEAPEQPLSDRSVVRCPAMQVDALHRTLWAHVAADAVEAGHRARMLALLEAREAAFRRTHFGPGHFTASAFVLSPDGRSILLILHAKLGRWLQPGGHLEPGDANVEAAARREVFEETGLSDVDLDDRWPDLFDLDIHAIPPHPKSGEPGHEHFDLRVLLRARSVDVSIGDGVKDTRWVPLVEVPRVETDESVMRAVRKLVG